MSGNQGITSRTGLDPRTLRTEFWIFVIMLVLAIGGVAMSQSEDRGRWLWLYWYALVLALSCYLAGVQFDWTFMLLGGILALIAVAIGFLDQLSVFLVVLPAAAVAVLVVFKHKFLHST